MFTEVEVNNFKAFGKAGVNLALAPLTIVLGENNSGKTSLLEAIALLAQSPSHPGTFGFLWKGPLVDLGDGSRAWFQGDKDRWLTIGIGYEGGRPFSQWLRLNSPGTEDRHPSQFGYRVAHRGATNEWRHELLIGGHVQARNELLLTKGDFRTRSMTQQLSLPSGGVYQSSGNATSILVPELFLGSPAGGVGTTPAGDAATMNECALLVQFLRETMPKHVFFVGADRGPKEEAPQQMPQDDLSVGRKGEHTFSVASLLFASSQYARQADRIQYWASEFGMPQFRGGFTRAPVLEAGYVDSATGTALTLKWAGYGSQQILPVIVQLFSAPPSSLIMIEEPEISLHPGAQVSLVRMFSEAVASGQQVIITTHSQTLLLALSEASKSNLTPAELAVYHMARGSDGAGATKLSLDGNWSLKGWVPSFSKVEGDLLKKWIASAHDDIAKKER
jgi:hypothetical protein